MNVILSCKCKIRLLKLSSAEDTDVPPKLTLLELERKLEEQYANEMRLMKENKELLNANQTLKNKLAYSAETAAEACEKLNELREKQLKAEQEICMLRLSRITSKPSF